MMKVNVKNGKEEMICSLNFSVSQILRIQKHQNENQNYFLLEGEYKVCLLDLANKAYYIVWESTIDRIENLSMKVWKNESYQTCIAFKTITTLVGEQIVSFQFSEALDELLERKVDLI